jgi:pilus assembly protein CpaB
MIALTTVMLARNILSTGKTGSKGEQAATSGNEILVAARDLPSGTLIKDSDMKWAAWPTKDTGKYVSKDKGSTAEYAGTVVRYGMREGEPIVSGRVVKAGQSGFMAAALAPGMRAVSISITAVAGVAGLFSQATKWT